MSDASAAVTPIENNVGDALQRLLEQYASSPNLVALFSAIASQHQLLEDALNAVAQGRLFFGNAATGQQLDNIGSLVGLSRNGLSDAQYQLLLQGQVLVNNTTGALPSLTQILSLIYEAQIFIKTPLSPGFAADDIGGYIAYCIFGAGLPQAQFALASRIVQRALPAGVALSYVAQSTGTKQGTFAMDGPQAWVGGFGDSTKANVGGAFANLLYANPTA